MTEARRAADFDTLNRQLMEKLEARDSQALKLIGRLRAMGVRRKDNRIIGYAYYRYAYYYYFTNQDIQQFRRYIKLAIRYLLRSDDKEYLGGAYNLVAYDAQDLGCYDVAYAYFMIAVQTSEEQEGIALPGLIEASAGRLLIEMGEYKKGRRQQMHAIRRLRGFTGMHVYHYNMIVTYADIALASFLIEDLAGVARAISHIEAHFEKAGRKEKELSQVYYLLTYVYKALLSKDDDLLEEMFPQMQAHWGRIPPGDQAGLIFEIETICKYMLAHDYISQTAEILEETAVIARDDNPTVALRYHTLKVDYCEKVHDLAELKKCLRAQHEIQKRQKAESARTIRYAMEFSDMIEAIGKERKKAKEENLALQARANTDALTGLPNRAAVVRRLQQEFDEAAQAGTSFGIGIIDVDYFKQYNDRYGHQAGDVCLQHIGRALQTFNTDPHVFCGRYGGDEFLVGYFGLDSRKVREIAEEMRRAVALACSGPERETVQISQGLYNIVPDGRKKLWEHLSVADKRLYQIKNRRVDA